MKSLNPFPYIYKAKFDFDWKALKGPVKGHLSAAAERIQEYNINTHEKDGGVSSVVINKIYPPHAWNEFEEFRPWLFNQVDDLWNKWNLAPMERHLDASWINVHPPGAYTEEHHHQNVTIAVAAYLHVPKDSGRFMIKNPLLPYLYSMPLHYYYFDDKREWEYIEVESGDVLFFPGWMTHKTEKNLSDKDRYVMSLNIMGNYVNDASSIRY